MKTRSLLLTILITVVLWRVVIHSVSFVSDSFLEYKPSFPYSAEKLAISGLDKSIYSFANFDGVHYITIVTNGYVGTGLIQAFFPLYPVLLFVLYSLGFSVISSGLFVSFSFLVAFLFAFVKLQTIDDKVTNNWKLVAVVLLFPTAFFFTSLYAESLFLFLVISSFIFARKRLWLLAVFFAALASATKVVGIALVPALMLEVLIQTKGQHYSKRLPLLVLMCLGGMGLLVYMAYLQITFNDALYFFHVQSEFGAGRQESIILLPQVLYRYIKILITYRPFDWKYFSFVQDFALFTLTATVLFVQRKKIRSSYLLFSILALLIPTLTGSLSSIPRYVLACFPLFMVVSHSLSSKPKQLAVWLVISGILLIINTILFVQGYWVA